MTKRSKDSNLGLAARFVKALDDFIRVKSHGYDDKTRDKARRKLEDVLEEILGPDDNK